VSGLEFDGVGYFLWRMDALIERASSCEKMGTLSSASINQIITRAMDYRPL
jgi:hypothetical protein